MQEAHALQFTLQCISQGGGGGLGRGGSPSALYTFFKPGRGTGFEMRSFPSPQSSRASLEQFQILQDALAADIQKLSRNVQSLKRPVNQLGTSKDAWQYKTQKMDTRRELQCRTKQMAEDATAAIKTLQAQLRSLPKEEQRVRKLQLDRLRDHLLDVANEFQSLQIEEQNLKRQQREQLRARAPSLTVFNGPLGRADENGGVLMEPKASESIGFQGDIQRQPLMYEDLAALREGEITLRELEGNIEDMNQIFTELAAVVHDQGQMVDDIGANVENAQFGIDQGNRALQKTKSYLCSLRRKKCIIASIFIVCGIFIVVGLIIYLYPRK
ncbi:unnamed protein product [Darwinula stevensoni]|uniref:t-SNARE coiled-coil homology domain-containing protein n=1 Tax=Darwinula stevensoni TaxID=69355 RepID=A0A7R8XC68_9CRUS|nr:unnamed protein product [Darwinula stevensoni]CAG0887404.1 unnamed protein product [Darwinula stevensoni]